MSKARTEFPPVRACLFDMDGLLIDSETHYSRVTDEILARYGRPPMPWRIKARLQGRPGAAATAIFDEWAQLPVTSAEYAVEQLELKKKYFPLSQPLPGVETLLSTLAKAKTQRGEKVHIALATSSHADMFELKTAHLEDMFAVFQPGRRVLGDDVRIKPGRGKPSPDIYLLALDTVNAGLEEGEEPIRPEECLVFEDSVPGIEAGRRAGMRVVWVPYEGLAKEYQGREAEVLAARTGEGGDDDLHLLGDVGDGWGDHLQSLETFPYEKFGIVP